MTILDTFYLFFKTNSDDAEKGVKRVDKATKDLEKSAKKTNEETEKLGKSFVNVVENATAAITAVLSLGAIKAGVMNAQQFNSNLEVQSKLLRQNAQDMKSYAAATESAGGTQQGFLSFLQGSFEKASEAGIPLPPVDVLMQRLRAALKGRSAAGQQLAFSRLGVTDPGLKSLLLQSDAEFEKSIAQARKHAEATEKDTRAAREFNKQWAETAQSLDTAFTKLGTDIFPKINPFLEDFRKFLNDVESHKGGIEAFFTVMAVGAIAASRAVGKLTASLLGLGGASAAGGGLMAMLGRLGIIGAGAVAGYESVQGVSSLIDGKPRGSYLESGAQWLSGKIQDLWYGKDKPNRAQTGKTQKESYDFWISQGYSPAAAAALVANEQAESGFDPNARGDGGTAFGSFQWHQTRRRSIYKALGIDVASAGHADQLRAAAWELQNMGLADQLKGMTDAGAAGAFVSRRFEIPANATGEAAKRAQAAMGIAASISPSLGATSGTVGGKSISVKTGDIAVHTQATDANGIARDVSGALESQIRAAMSNLDDGENF